MKASVLDLRYRMKDVLQAIDRGETVTVLYRGKEKASILPIANKNEEARAQDQEFFGLWKNRPDLADPAALVRKLRQPRFGSVRKKR